MPRSRVMVRSRRAGRRRAFWKLPRVPQVGGRALCSAAVLLAVTGVSAVALVETVDSRSGRQLACRILSNRMVPLLAARSRECPLRAYDRVLALELGGRLVFVQSRGELVERLPDSVPSVTLRIRRRGSEQSVAVPVDTQTRGEQLARVVAGILIAAVLLAIALLILWTARTVAGLPLLLLLGCLSVILVDSLAGRDSRWLEVSESIAVGFLPATLTHLALTFPRERPILALVPPIVRVPYGLAALLVAVSLGTQMRSPITWATADRLMILLACLGATCLILGAWLAARQAGSALERMRARIFLAGMLGVVGVPGLVGAGLGGQTPGGSATLVGLAAILFPLPIGYAISRFQLFDVGLDVQRALARLLAPTVLALLLAGITLGLDAMNVLRLPTREPVAWFGILYALLLACEALRAPLWTAADGWASRRLEILRRLRDRHARAMGELRSVEDVGRILGGTIREALGARWVCIVGGAPESWRSIFMDGTLQDDSLPSASTLERSLADAPDLVHLAREDPPDPGSGAPRSTELLARLRSGNEGLGIALVGPSESGQPYTSVQLEFVRSVCVAAAVAIHNANLTQDLMAAERFAAVGRLGAGLAHEIAKPLGLLERLALRLPGRMDRSEQAERDAARIYDLARELRGTVRGILAGAQGSTGEAPALPAEELAERAVQLASRRCPRARFRVRASPHLPVLASGDERLAHAIANLLENAALASGSEDPVELEVRPVEKQVVFEVVDRGPGMCDAVAGRAFEPFFTTREREGTGLGLYFAREAIEGSGGRVTLDSDPKRGTRVRAILPARARGREG